MLLREPHHSPPPNASRSGVQILSILFALSSSTALSACADDKASDDSTDTGVTPTTGSTTANDTGTTSGSTTGGSSDSSGMNQETSGGETGGTAPTYWQDVAPIHADKCLGCHRTGGAAFTMEGYNEAKRWAAAAAAASGARRMPPWLATSDGSCGEFRDSMALSDAQIATLQSWADGGTPEGTPVDIVVPDVPVLPSPTSYTTPEFYPVPGGDVLDLYDEYRCFLVDPKLAEPMFATGYHVKPGNEAIVHHLIAMVVDPEEESHHDGMTNAQVMEALDADSPDRLGWPCFNEAGPGVNISYTPISWAPGQEAVFYPEGTGLTVNPTDRIVVQMHYNLADEANLGSKDQTEFQLQYAPTVNQPADILVLDQLLGTIEDEVPHTLPPGEAAVEYNWELPFDWVFGGLPVPYMELHGLGPHMHERGSKYRIDIVNESSNTCAVDIQDWDFNWQHLYFYQQPSQFKPGDVMKIKCTYDTSNDIAPIFPGWGTRNEMCTIAAYLAAPAGASPELRSAIRERIQAFSARH